MEDSNTADEYIFSKVKNDDEKAFELLFKKYYTPLSRYAFTFLKNTDDSEEIAQEVFITIWNNREKIIIKTSLKSYLYTSIRNHSLNYLKKAAKDRTENIEDLQYFDVVEEDTPSQRDSAEFEQKIYAAIESLPDKCKEIFTLSRVENLKNREIAERLNISIKTVENQMTIALKKMRDQVKIETQ